MQRRHHAEDGTSADDAKRKQTTEDADAEDDTDDVAAAAFGDHSGDHGGQGDHGGEEGGGACGSALRGASCPTTPRRVIVTLSIGKRSHFKVTRVPMQAYAQRVGADLEVVDSPSHPCLAAWNATLQIGANSHFMKLPLLQYFLQRYDQLLFLDDDVLLSPHAPDVFRATPCGAIGAVVEGYHKQGWHTMHMRSVCSIYGLGASHPAVCGTEALKQQARIFNSGVMVLSKHHLPLLAGWDAHKLECRILCDQLYMNAMASKHGACLHDLGNAFNLPGTQVRRELMTTQRARHAAVHASAVGEEVAGASPASAAALLPSLKGTALGSSCFVHLTVLPAKPHTSHYLLQRSLKHADLMRCDYQQGTHALAPSERASMLRALPDFQYDIEKIWCKGRAKGCQVIPPPPDGAELRPSLPLPGGASGGGDASSGGGGGGSGDSGGGASGAAPPTSVSAQCAAHRAAAAMALPLMPPSQSNASEVPAAARQLLHRAASSAWDCNTVILLFATADFFDLAINWAQAATSIGVTNFVLVAMDKPLADILGKFDLPPGLLLPRVASGDVTITKLNVIGERQRFGLRVLESGFNVLFADLDALFLRSPAPILADGDIIGERIWGRPMSVVKKWGAAICTGFYFMRSNPRTIAIFRQTHAKIVAKRLKQPKWQASDQWAINHAVDDHDVVWHTPMPMKGMGDPHTKFDDLAPSVGFTKRHRSKFVVLPHVHVARSCPILRHGTAPPPSNELGEVKKYALWRKLLKTAYALHCFPPDSMPCPEQKHGEKGCDKSVIMGSAVHIHGEVVFDQRQGLWFMKQGWEQAIKAPRTTDFFAWLKTQHNGAKPGDAPA